MEGMMAMQGAAPLVRAAFVALAALYGPPTAPDRPEQLEQRDVCSLSGERPGPDCPGRKHEWFTPAAARNLDAAPPCSFHVHAAVADNGARASVRFPPQLAPWARAHALPDLARGKRASSAPLAIVYPAPDSLFQLDPHRSAAIQVPPLQALPADGVSFQIDGRPAREFRPSPGRHLLRAQRAQESVEREIVYE
jgi:hypothetical protein